MGGGTERDFHTLFIFLSRTYNYCNFYIIFFIFLHISIIILFTNFNKDLPLLRVNSTLSFLSLTFMSSSPLVTVNYY